MGHTKTCQESDIPTKIIKENAYIFSKIRHLSFDGLVKEGTFPSIFKLADVNPIFLKKFQRTLKITTDQSAF